MLNRIAYSFVVGAFLFAIKPAFGQAQEILVAPDEPIAIADTSDSSPTVIPTLPPLLEIYRICFTKLDCLIYQHILSTEHFLSSRKGTLPYTPDPRPLTPFAEVVRLDIDMQALGYLNLFKITRQRRFLKEATDRLDYIYSLGNTGLRNTSFDGQIGYSFLLAYEITNNPTYKSYGLMIADHCIAYDYVEHRMNWGYMCAMNAGKAYKLTQDPKYLTATRDITRNTPQFQYPDGSFPHQANIKYGENLSYTAWLTFEMLHHRMDDLNNPDMEPSIIKSVGFLQNRVSTDGSLSYEDAAGTYGNDPGNADGRGWTNDLPAAAYDLFAGGYQAKAAMLLKFLFSLERKGENLGGYPDKWEYTDPTMPWTMGDPSVVRSSIIFWYLTEIYLMKDVIHNGHNSSCTVTPTDCHPLYQEFGLCNSGRSGYHTTLNGITTKCLNANDAIYTQSVCSYFISCDYDRDDDSTDAQICKGPGTSKCVGLMCDNTCAPLIDAQDCNRELFQGDVCPY